MTAVFSRKYRVFIICCYKLPGLLEKVISFYLNLIEAETEKIPDEIVTEMRSTEQTGCRQLHCSEEITFNYPLA